MPRQMPIAHTRAPVPAHTPAGRAMLALLAMALLLMAAVLLLPTVGAHQLGPTRFNPRPPTNDYDVSDVFDPVEPLPIVFQPAPQLPPVFPPAAPQPVEVMTVHRLSLTMREGAAVPQQQH